MNAINTARRPDIKTSNHRLDCDGTRRMAELADCVEIFGVLDPAIRPLEDVEVTAAWEDA